MKPIISLRDLSASSDASIKLLPTQEQLYNRLKRASNSVPVVACVGPQGLGRSTILRRLAKEIGAEFIDPLRINRAIQPYDPYKVEDVISALIENGLRRRGKVVFDGFAEVMFSYGLRSLRGDVLGDFVRRLCDRTIRNGHRLILGGNFLWRHGVVDKDVFGEAAAMIRVDPFVAEDYRSFFEGRFGERVSGVDFAILHALAPMLTLTKLHYIANRVADLDVIDLSSLQTVIEQEVLASNLRLNEVEALSFDSLPGTEHIARALETHIVLPFEHKELAAELGLKPRRGVLLYGPPGTGKTSIGRALAHRMKGRFFLIDGSFITEPPSHFFDAVDAIVAKAKANAPCVLFIDDADVLFQIPHVQGLSRYLLSLLDGIESETASKVCIMLTAMDASKLPAPLLRSGRIELWLETKAPNAATRAGILKRWMPDGMPELASVDYERLAALAEGFTPADLRRLASDAKLFFAADHVAGKEPSPAQHYLERAYQDLMDLRETMASRLAADGQRERYYA